MGHWEDVRRKARACRADALALTGGDASAAALLTASEDLAEVRRLPVKKGDVLLDGGVAVLDRAADIIWYDRDTDPRRAVFYQAHECGHFWLDDRHTVCTTADIDAEEYEEPLPLGERRVEGYGPDERSEREANVFAREFLMPTDVLKDWYLVDGLDAAAIADRVGVPDGMVFHQLTRALLTPEIADVSSTEEAPEGEQDLDPSQQEAARVERGPLLLEDHPRYPRLSLDPVLFLPFWEPYRAHCIEADRKGLRSLTRVEGSARAAGHQRYAMAGGEPRQ